MAPPLRGATSRPLHRLVNAVWVHRHLAIVLLAGLAVRLALLAHTEPLPLRIVDEQHYAALATSLLHGHGFAWEPGRATSIRPPLYPLFIAGVWRLAGSESLQAARAANVVLALLMVIAVYRLAARLFDRRVAVTAAVIVAFYPSLLFSGLLLLTEVLFTLLVVVLTLQHLGLVDRPTPGRALLLGATVGAAALTRSALWPLPIVLVPLLVLSLRGPWRRRIHIATCVVAGYLLVVAPWAARNTQLQRTLTIVDTMGGLNLRMGNYEHTPEDRMWDAVTLTGQKSWSHALAQAHPDSALWTEGQREKWAQREAIAYMLSNPATTARRSLLKFFDFWGLERELLAGLQQRLYQPPVWFARLATVATVVSYPLVLLAGAVGFLCAARVDRPTHAFILVLVVFLTAIHSLVFGHSRYHLPLVPLLAMYAAAACSPAPRRALRANPRLAAAAVLTCAMFITIWCREVLFRDAVRISGLFEALR